MEENNDKRDDPIDDGLSLIERARLKAPPAQKLQIENEEFELVKLWLSGELTNSQIMFAYKYKGSGAISRMAIVLREMYRLDKLILK